MIKSPNLFVPRLLSNFTRRKAGSKLFYFTLQQLKSMKHCEVVLFFLFIAGNSFQTNYPFIYPLKKSENLRFQGVWKWNLGLEWVDDNEGSFKKQKNKKKKMKNSNTFYLKWIKVFLSKT